MDDNGVRRKHAEYGRLTRLAGLGWIGYMPTGVYHAVAEHWPGAYDDALESDDAVELALDALDEFEYLALRDVQRQARGELERYEENLLTEDEIRSLIKDLEAEARSDTQRPQPEVNPDRAPEVDDDDDLGWQRMQLLFWSRHPLAERWQEWAHNCFKKIPQAEMEMQLFNLLGPALFDAMAHQQPDGTWVVGEAQYKELPNEGQP